MRNVITPTERGSAHQAQPDMFESDFEEPASFEEPAPTPVFVSRSGMRGRLLRGLGWPVSVTGAILAVAMGSSLVGVQADAPAMGIPVQPSRSPVTSPSPTPSPSPSASPSSSSSPRTGTRSATPSAKTSGATAKSTTTTSHAATPSGQASKHP
ncbi:hypothetical protein AB0K51_00140 [Kitasatospora sp. NPDC049285]|uniref:hypothetical protein n=1 Tax=Kitasatospora sp. NPDC049285 TaxID=3157096 RepID=UPI0034210403